VEHERGGANRPQQNSLARELVSDSRVLIEHARLLVRNSRARIEGIETRLERFVAALEAAERLNVSSAKRLRVEILRWFDRRDAA